jgi:hypothetical protein
MKYLFANLQRDVMIKALKAHEIGDEEGLNHVLEHYKEKRYKKKSALVPRTDLPKRERRTKKPFEVKGKSSFS